MDYSDGENDKDEKKNGDGLTVIERLVKMIDDKVDNDNRVNNIKT